MLLETCYYVTLRVLSLAASCNRYSVIWMRNLLQRVVQYSLQKLSTKFSWVIMYSNTWLRFFLVYRRVKVVGLVSNVFCRAQWSLFGGGEKKILTWTFVFLIFACWPLCHIDLSEISAGWHTGAVSVSLWPLHFIIQHSIKLWYHLEAYRFSADAWPRCLNIRLFHA